VNISFSNIHCRKEDFTIKRWTRSVLPCWKTNSNTHDLFLYPDSRFSTTYV
jgi:hypothetical protein